MSALDQYINLFRSARGIIDGNSSVVLNDRRGEACHVLEKIGLPKKGMENYEHSDIDRMLAPDFGLNLAKLDMDINPGVSFHCGVPNMSTSLYFMFNDTCTASTLCRPLPVGVFAGSLREFARLRPEVADKYYGRIASMENPLVALDTMFAQDGFVLHVEKGVRLSTPLQLVNILASGRPLMAVRRMLIIMEEDSEATVLVCDHTQNQDINFLSLQTVEIFAGKNSRLDFYDLEESSEKTSRLSSLYLCQEEGSNVLLDGITLFNGITRNEYYCSFCGENAELHLLGMGIEDKNRNLETYSRVDHLKPKCQTDELMKFTVDDNALASFAGRIYVAPGAEKTVAYQSNRNIVGNPNARMFSKPQLEIYNDDVKCSHGTAIGQLDAMQLFYMRTRGLSEDMARLMLKQAFMADVINGVRLEPLKDRLHHLVERRFSGAFASCSSCQGVCGAID